MKRPHEIDRFDKYLEEGKIQQGGKDPSQARSLLKRSESKFETMEKLGVDEDTATDYLENVYESCKMLIQSMMSLEGLKPYSHESIIAYAIDELELDMVNSNSLNRYRKLRNDIAYRGEIATEKEASSIRSLYVELRKELKPSIEQKLEN